MVFWRPIAAIGPEIDVPVALFDKDRDAFVAKIPANIIKIGARFGCFDRKRNISAAHRAAIEALIFLTHVKPFIRTKKRQYKGKRAVGQVATRIYDFQFSIFN